jgi:hypothetical protein
MNENANNTDVTRGEDPAPAPPMAGAALAEIETLIGELKAKVDVLRDDELDAPTLEQRLRELNELAARVAAALDSAAR